jgi:hypothetical protein
VIVKLYITTIVDTDGKRLIRTFYDRNEATEHARSESNGLTWWIVQIETSNRVGTGTVIDEGA